MEKQTNKLWSKQAIKLLCLWRSPY